MGLKSPNFYIDIEGNKSGGRFYQTMDHQSYAGIMRCRHRLVLSTK